jgi:hypothetical protein
MQDGVALEVALECRAAAVELPAVELDDELVRRPVGVDLIALHVGIAGGQRQAVLVTEVVGRVAGLGGARCRASAGDGPRP